MDSSPDIIVLKFADSKVPVFKETRNKDYIKYGEDNLYPDYLTHLFNKSAKHNAIINGKANYIFGKGYENGNVKLNRLNDTLNDISKKSILDRIIYGGFRLEIIWGFDRRISEVYHVDYNTLRKGKDGGFYYKENWKADNRDEEIFIPSFDPTDPVGTQIFEYNEYRPGVKFYPLPDYIGCNNYIETDIEISKYYLSAIRNGMMPSKMIQMYGGTEPTEEKKAEIERRWGKKFSGAENAGRFIFVFAGSKEKSFDVTDLSASELDKHFQELNKTCQQEIFSGHSVTSPTLFGIKTEGQLGGNTELKTAYSIFQNTYSKPKAADFDKEINWLLSYSNFPGIYELMPSDPIGWQIPDSLLAQAITPDEARISLGLPAIEKPIDSEATKTINALTNLSPLVANKILDNLTKNEIRSLAALPPVSDGDFIPAPDGSRPEQVSAPTLDADNPSPINDAIRSMTTKQHQQLLRIIRQFGKGQLTEQAAKVLLRTGLGLSEEDINGILGINVNDIPAMTDGQIVSAAMSIIEKNITDDHVIQIFDGFGVSKNDYEIIKTKKVCFSENVCEEDEEVYIHEAFKTYDVTLTESKILELIKKDAKITADVIAVTIGETKLLVERTIENLVKRGYIETSIEKIGTDEIIKRIVPKSLDIIAPPAKGSVSPTEIYIKYSYEGPEDSRNRPFCAKLMSLNRLYSRVEIEKITRRLGYSVFDRRGGFWNNNGTILPYCRHSWKSNIIIKKGGSNVS